MTLSTTISRKSAATDGMSTVFTYPYYFLNAADLVVIKKLNSTGVETPLVLNTDYTVSGAGNPSGGSITTIGAGSPIASGYTLTIYRDPSVVQETHLVENDPLPAAATEKVFDLAAMVSQRLSNWISRTSKLSDGMADGVFDPTWPVDIALFPNAVPLVNPGGTGFALAAAWPTGPDIVNAQAWALISEGWATNVTGLVNDTIGGSGVDNSAKAYAIGGTGAGQPAGGDAKSWAIKISAAVITGQYSAKEWATGVQTRGQASGGSSKDWANYTGGTVDNTEFSAKKYANDSAASAATAAAIVASMMWDDVVFKDFSNSPIALSSSDRGKLYNIDCSGGNVVVNLPQINPLDLSTPFVVGVRKSDSSANKITVNAYNAGDGTDKIDGGNSEDITGQNNGLALVPEKHTSPNSWEGLEFGLPSNTATTNTAQVITNKDIDGGVAANNRRITIPGATKSTLDGLTRKAGTILYGTDTEKFYGDDGSILKGLGGSGQGGINYILNPDAEVDTSGWATYADAAGTTPVDGTGGSPASTWTRSTSNPLRDLASFIFTKSANNRQGEGASYDFTIDRADRNKILSIEFDHEIASGTFVTGDNSDIRVFIYDVTNAQLITPANFTIQSSPGKFQATFPSSSSTSYRLILHVATTSALAYTFKVDDVQVGPQEIVFGPAMTDWKDGNSIFTPAANAFGTVTNKKIFYRRVGDMLHVRGTFTAGSTAGNPIAIGLPSWLAIDSTKLSNAGSYLNGISTSLSSTNTTITPAAYLCYPIFDGSDVNNVYFSPSTTSGAFDKGVGGSFAQSGQPFVFEFSIPIQGWSTNVASANSSVFRISDILANGTRVTGSAPTALGQYRSYLRNSSALTFTETNGAPTAAPSSADGIALYAGGAWGSADTNNQPTKYEIFIGKRKYFKIEAYKSTGRTGQANLDGFTWNGSSVAVGQVISYDPNTGILTVCRNNFAGGSIASGGAATDGADGNSILATAFFDVIVSENALAVQQQSPRSQVEVVTGVGFGSGGTTTRTFSAPTVKGDAITYTSDHTNGDTFTINEDGLYAMSYTEIAIIGNNDTVNFGITKNASNSTAITSLAAANVIQLGGTTGDNGNNGYANVSATVFLPVGTIIRAQTDGIGLGGGATATYVKFIITQVAK